MCGILGFVGARFPDKKSLIESGLSSMSHRGPDARGVWLSKDNLVGLGHVRLSIIELTEAGSQPMVGGNERYIIVFNGEIYNFRSIRQELAGEGYNFVGESDTEVLLKSYIHWGERCVNKIQGMFSFCIYDAEKMQMFLARDRVGEKPLYYAHHNGSLSFSSEIKGLLVDRTLNRKVSLGAIDKLLMMGYVPADLCIFESVKKVPAGCALTYKIANDTVDVYRYWQMPDYAPVEDEEALLDEFCYLLEQSVQKQMIADVPIGVLLSGGVDSSLVTAMAAKAQNKVKTFSVRFPGYGRFDETEHARLVANFFGTEHVELVPSFSSIDVLPKLAAQYDEPIFDSSIIPTYLVCELVKGHCKVALGGDGGDELFGGYKHYSRLIKMKRYASKVPLKLRANVSMNLCEMLPTGFKGRNWIRAMGQDFEGSVPLIACYFDRQEREKLLPGLTHTNGFADDDFEKLMPRIDDFLQRATRLDFNNYLTEDILVKVDRASMLNSLEMRAPFLDQNVIEFAFQKVPSKLKANLTKRKIFLRKVCDRVLPKDFDSSRKQGFSIPLAQWLGTNEWRDLIHEFLLENEHGLFKREVVRELYDGQMKGRSNSERLFGLLMIELWRSEYGAYL